MKTLRLYMVAALLFAFCLRAGGQTPVSSYHLTLGPEWTQDLVSGQDYFVWIDIDRTGTLPVFTSIVYQPGYLGTDGTQMQIKTVSGAATYDPFALLECGDVILSETPGLFSVSYSARWKQANGVLGGGYISVLQCVRDAGFVYIPPSRGCDNLFLPVANASVTWQVAPSRKRGRVVTKETD